MIMALMCKNCKLRPAKIHYTEIVNNRMVTMDLCTECAEEKGIEVSLADNVLTIRGERKLDKEEKEQSYYLRERARGAFRRSLSFPVQIDENKVKAVFADGVLSITLPKIKEAQKKVKTSAIASK